MGNAFNKIVRRSIRGTIGRFLAILGIVAMGCGFFAGLQMCGPDMRIAADRYYDGTNLWDVRLISTLGFTDDDIERVKAIGGVDQVMPAYSTDVMARLGDEQTPVRVSSLPSAASDAERTDVFTVSSGDDDYLNRVILCDGRWPKSDDEAVISADKAVGDAGIGDSVEVLYGSGNLDDTLSVRTFTIVGTVTSADYPYTVSFGSTTLGSGILDQYMFVPFGAFVEDSPYTELYLTVDGAADELSGGDDYQETVDRVIDAIDKRIDDLAQARLDDIKADAQQELDSQRSVYEQNRDNADSQLADAKTQLDDAATQIADGERQLADGQRQYDDGVAQLDRQRTDAYAQLDDAQRQIDANRTTVDDQARQLEANGEAIEQARTQYRQGMQELTDSLAQLGMTVSGPDDAVEQLGQRIADLDASRGQVADGISQADTQIGTLTDTVAQLRDAIDDLNRQRTDLDDSIASIEADRQTAVDDGTWTDEQEQEYQTRHDELAAALAEADGRLASLNDQQAQAQSGLQAAQDSRDRLNAQLTQIDQSRPQLQSALDGANALVSARDQIDQYDQGVAAVEEARRQIDDAQKQLDSSRAQTQNQLADAQRTLDESAARLQDSRNQLDSAKQDYDQGLREYEANKTDVEGQLADAAAELDDAQRRINDMDGPDIYVLDRTQSEGAASYQSDSQRIDSIADVFPFIFFLVAALVSLTTMTRMVEDDRIEIGTYKALGYGTARIAGKYLVYAAAASVIGAIVGIGVLSQVLPSIVMAAYGIIYTVPTPPLPLPVDAPTALLAGGVGVAVTLLATWWAVVSSLKASPAALMLPRVPKAGRRILLERIGPVWRRLSFSWKVTCRNIFRYKRRFFMTVIGISGCTALLLVGFGVHDAIWDIIDNQYEDVQHYNTVISMDADAGRSDIAAVMDVLRDNGADDTVRVQVENMQATDASSPGQGSAVDGERVQVVVPRDSGRLSDVVTFRERVGHRPIAFDDDSVVITEKAAKLLGVTTGDTIRLYRQDGTGNASGSGHEAVVTGVMENYVGNAVYMGRDAWSRMVAGDADLDADPLFSTMYANLPADQQERDAVADDVQAVGHVSTVSFSSVTIDMYRTMLGSVNMVVIVLIVAAAMLAFIVLYNLTNINIEERVREIASLKVLGFTRMEVYAYIFREILLLSLVGNLIGLALGTFLEGFVIETAEVDMVMFGRVIHAASYGYAFLLTMLFTVLVVLVMRHKLDRVDMVESLKSVD